MKLELHSKIMRYIKIFILVFYIFLYPNTVLSADVYFVDIKKILNESKAGKQAQNFLKKQFESQNKKFATEATNLKKEEKDLISQKKIISPEEYKKKLNTLRAKSATHQKNKRQASNEWLKKKNEARSKLMKTLSPLMQKYMKENNVEVIVDKKYILLANSNFDLTDEILKILDKELKSINLN